MWLLLATLASMFWGVEYSINEQLYRKISVPTVLAIEGLAYLFIAIGIIIFTGTFRADIATLGSSWRLMGLIAVATCAVTAATFLTGFVITYQNATLAGLIEISYPLFIALFAYLLFKESELNVGTSLGGLLIFGGVALVYWFR